MEEKTMQKTQIYSPEPNRTNNLLWILLVVFIAAAILIGVLSFSAAHNVVASGSPFNPGSPEFSSSQGGAVPTDTLAIPQITPTLNSPSEAESIHWDGNSRVTILVMGLDYRDWKKKDGPPRTDSMILLTIDPVSKTAGMLSIPRDLWVNIPNYGYYKINMAYYFGEGDHLPGGGPGLAVKTVEQFLGVPINYYAQIDFEAFVKFINELDGITIDVPAEIEVDPIGKENTVILKPGLQTLDGELALAYARARHTDFGDFDRSRRQQQVILSVRRRLEKLGPGLIPKAPAIYNDLASGIHTNMTFDEAMQLGMLALKIDHNNVQQKVIGPPDQVLLAKSPDGSQDILKPITEKIRLLRDELFASSGAIAPSITSTDPAGSLKAENAQVVFLNGSGVGGMAAKTGDYFKSQGVSVVSTGDAGDIYPYTTIVDYTGKPYTLKYLVDVMKIQPNQIRLEYKPGSEMDIAVFIGSDWSQNNPMP